MGEIAKCPGHVLAVPIYIGIARMCNRKARLGWPLTRIAISGKVQHSRSTSPRGKNIRMNYGLPIVANKVDGLIEIFEHNKSALLVNMFDKQEKYVIPNAMEMSEYIARLLKGPKLSKSLIDFSYRRVKNHFSLRNMVNNYVELANL